MAASLLALLEPYFRKEEISVVVSDRSKNAPFMKGYPVKEISEFYSMREEVFVIIAVMPEMSRQIEGFLKNLDFSHYCTVSELIDRLYTEIWKHPVEKNKIVFVNGSGWGFGGNPKYVALDLMRTEKTLELVWAAEDPDTKLPDGIRIVKYGSYEYYQELGTARVWIDNQHKNLFTRKRSGQVYMQTWHGGGPLKKIEFDAKGLPGSYLELCEMNSKMEDIMVSPTAFNSMLYRRAFHYTGEIMECGYPRNDIFWKPDIYRNKIKEHCGIRAEEGIVLYAPTFRETNSRNEALLDLEAVKDALEYRFGKRYHVFVRCHPSDKESAEKYAGCKGWMNMTDYEDPQELLAAADILITDYSSIMWDFSLQKKPVFLFHPDLKSYEKERGYYLSFEMMPYIEAFSNADLNEKIAEFDEKKYEEEMDKFLKEYGSFDKGNAAEAVTRRLLEIMRQEG